MVRVVLLVVLAAGCARTAETSPTIVRPPKLELDLTTKVGEIVEVTGRIDECTVGAVKAGDKWVGVDLTITLSCERVTLSCEFGRLPEAPNWFRHDLPRTLITLRGRVQSAGPGSSGSLEVKLVDCEVVREPWRPT